MRELLCHLFGDYVFQNHWMASRKASSSLAAGIHASIYTLSFLLITRSPVAILVILVTHFFIDRFRLAKYWVQFYGVGNTGWIGSKLGLDVTVAPDWLAVWLLIIVDNTAHLTINHLSILYL
jgi:hypothetical protein